MLLYLRRLLFTFLSVFLLFSTSLYSVEMTQQERNEMAAKLIPIISMLLLDDGDSLAPVLTLEGDSNITIELDSRYLEYGVVALDNIDGNITDKITIISDVNTSKVGTYTVRYAVIDNAGNKSEIIRTVNVIKSITFQDENSTVVFDSNASQILERYIVDENSSELNVSSKIIVISHEASNKMDESTKVVVIESDEKFPLGYTGKIMGSTSRADGSVELHLEDATLEDISHMELPQTTYDLKKMNFVGVISPFENTSPKAGQSLERGLQRAVIYEDDFDVNFDGEKINLQNKDESKIKIKLKDHLDLELLGSISNLKLTSKGEFLVQTAITDGKIVKVDFSEDLKLSYDTDFELALRGIYDGYLGYFDEYWKELEDIAFEKFGIALKGLNSNDKQGKIPIAGLVYNGALVGSTNIDSAFTASKAGGIIVWIYADMKGQLNLDGAIGIASHTHSELMFQKELEQTIPYVSSSITEQPNKRYLEAPFIEGKVGVTLTKGLSVEVDVIVGGLRIINIAGEAKGELKETIETESSLDGDATTNRLSYGLDTPDGIWKWSDGLICSKGSFGAGFILNANFAMGITYKDTLDREIILNYQYPKQSNIDDVESGQIGSWYKFASHKECLQVPNPGTLNANHVADVRIAMDESALPQVADDNYLYAYLSNRIYDDTGADLNIEKDGWILVDIDEDNANGFKAGLYRSMTAPSNYIIAYGGTTATSSDTWIGKTYDGIIDLVTDMSLLGVISTSQPSDALSFYKNSLTKVGTSGQLEAITGHSLGGGLAEYAGLYSGVKTVTFNTAPLPFNMLRSLVDDFQDKITVANSDGTMKSVHFNHEDKITNIMLPYDPVSTISTAIMSLDETNAGYMLAARFLLGIPAYQKMDYLITGEKIYLPISDFNGFANFSNHSMGIMKDILEANSTYNLSFDLIQDGNNINVTNRQVSGSMQSLMPIRYRWEAYNNGELVASAEGLDTITDLGAGTFTIKIYALLPNALWVSSEKVIVIDLTPTNVTILSTRDSITLNWDEVPDALLYKICMSKTLISDGDTCIQNGGVIIDAGSNTAINITENLESGTTYYFRVKGFNSDYNSEWSDELVAVWEGNSGVITHNGVSYDTVTSPHTGRIWLDRNLGASQVCTAYNDSACYGDYYQWGRGADGHEKVLSEDTITVDSSIYPLHSKFIDNYGDWSNVDINGNSRSDNWAKTDGTSICPIAFRVPTIDEFKAETLDINIATKEAVYNSFLKLGSASTKFGGSGNTHSIYGKGEIWAYWSNSSYHERTYQIGNAEGQIFAGPYDQDHRANGMPIRCIKDSFPNNIRPTANAGADLVVNVGESVLLSGADSNDSDGQIVSYEWQDTNGTIVSNDVNVTIDTSVEGNYTYTLIVTDNNGAKRSDSVSVFVQYYVSLVANAGEDKESLLGDNVSLDGSQSRSNDDVIMDYLWSENGVTIANCHGVNICTVNLPIGKHNITLTIYDNNNKSASDNVVVNVSRNINTPHYIRDASKSIVQDTYTTLFWQDDSGLYSTRGWYDAKNYCSALELGGYDDWRLPSSKELITLAEGDFKSTFQYFGSGSYSYWLWTSDNYNREYATSSSTNTISFYSYRMMGRYKTDADRGARCVRGYQPITLVRDSSNLVVNDTSNNLIWQDNSLPSVKTVEQANTYCSNLVIGNITNWRVPKISELLSISDVYNGMSSVFRNKGKVSTSNSNPYLSSTYKPNSSSYWYIDFGILSLGTTSSETATFYLRCVKGLNDQELEPETITHNGVTYGTVTSPYTGRVWLDRNLGASQVCTSFDDSACYGDYYQWGRDADGHQESNSTTTTTQATDINSAGSSFIISSSTYHYDWAYEADIFGSLREANWSVLDGSSICPVGFRVPEIDELKAELLDTGSTQIQNRDDAFNSFLAFPSAGNLNGSSGSFYGRGWSGYVWASSPSGSLATEVFFNGSVARSTSTRSRAYGLTVRCLRD